ncbi:RHS repeat-associated protein, partial [Comamonas sp. BIGb0152]|uniref:DUF6973 domain-containing protein n=1 Tax=Comamonas sp. BIGb0152 TaxID=2940601 RepID=UPI00286DF8BA
HREIHRQVLTDINSQTPGENTAKPLYRKLGWDAAGRMETMQWLGLEQGSALDDMLSIPGASQGGGNTRRVPPTLLGAMSAKQYYYDSLGQMVGMRSHAGISRFAYDAAGRLTGSHTPHAGSQRWQFDPAGNRLPIAGPETKPATPDAITGHLNETDRLRAQQRAAAQANPITKEQLLRSDFNPLQADPDPSSNQPLHTSKRWAGNRVAYYENQEDASSQGAKIHYEYDSRGNRVQSLDDATGRKLELMYDSGNQLVQVIVTDNEKRTAQQYRYDAFGRRLAKYSMPANSEAGDLSETDYFGWDGDRLIHTERFNSANAKDDDGAAQPEVIHTIYEPGSFTPLIQLRRASKAEPDLGDALLANTSPGVVQDALRSALADIKALNASLPQNIAFMSMSKDVQAFMREQLQDYEQTVSDQRQEAEQKVEIRHYLCDHLGTPNALIREDSRLDWAVQLDAWGNVRAEHNPGDLYQPIRLPGQHADGETGLYYNRHRYYEPGVGDYINQDPIGLLGGLHSSGYVRNPLTKYDSLGLIEEIAHIWNIGPLDAWNTRADNSEAFKRSKEKFAIHELHNGVGDAFRHCYWSCIMSLRMGVEQAKKVGDTHEVYGTQKRKQPEKEEIMDYHNNSKGRECSAFSDDKNDCEMNCDEKLGNGELWFIDETTGLLDTAIKIP